MAIIQQTTIGSIHVTKNGHLEVRADTVTLDNGVQVGEATYHRHTLAPGASLVGQDPQVVAIASKQWTPAVLAAEALRRASE